MKKQKIKKRSYFSGGDITSVASLAGDLAGNFVSAANYQFDPNGPAYKPDFQKGISQGLIGLIPELIKTNKDKKQRGAYVASATPGNYQQGGPITVNQPTSRGSRPSHYLPPMGVAPIPELNVMNQMFVPGLMSTPPQPAPNFVTPLLVNDLTGGSSKSKSKNKFREMAAGGVLEDLQLSNTSFQVKGNPNVTDGNSYPELNANLDHNEVIKENFVYSSKLKAPNGKPFSAEAMKIEKSTGNAQKKLMSNPADESAKNTIKMNESAMKSLAALQETIATAKGLRKPTRDFAYGGFTGGPDDPYTFPGERHTTAMNPFDSATGKRRRTYNADDFPGYLPAGNAGFIDLGRDGMYYDPYNKDFVVRNTKGSYVKVQPKEATFSIGGGNVKDIVTGKSFNIGQHLNYTPGTTQQPIASNTGILSATESQSVASSDRPDIYGESYGTSPRNSPRTGGRSTGKPAETKPPTKWDLLRQNLNKVPPTPYDNNAVPSDVDVLSQLGAAPDRYKADSRLSNLGPLKTPAEDSLNPMSMNPVGETGIAASEFITPNQNFTVGDGLQALTVASKFGQLVGGAEVEKPYYDTTRITKENFDPSNPLYQANRNFQQGLNSLQNSSINQNRSFMNNLYTSKLNQDSDILTKYNQMNQSAQTQQEARQSDQRRYNIGQTVGTNDINARNRAAYKEAVDVAFNSLGNLGKGLNEKKTVYDSLAVLQKMYPDVYARIMAEQQKAKPQ